MILLPSSEGIENSPDFMPTTATSRSMCRHLLKAYNFTILMLLLPTKQAAGFAATPSYSFQCSSSYQRDYQVLPSNNRQLLVARAKISKWSNRSPTSLDMDGDVGVDVSTKPSTISNLMLQSDKALTRRNTLKELVTTVGGLATLGILDTSKPVHAATDAKPREFTNVGTQAPTPKSDDRAFVTLSSGVKVKDIRVGTGEGGSVTSNSKRVNIQCSGRLLNLNGVSFYNTKNNNPDGFGAVPLVIDLGQGQALPGLEEGLVGMKKGGIRRIIVPQELAYNGYPNLEPQPMNAADQRALDSVVLNPRRDGAILFDVQVERFK